MRSLHRAAAVLLTAGAVVSLTYAQSPNPTTRGQDFPSGSHPAYARRQSVVHHNPYPYPEHYYSDQSGGFRNPGGIGRVAEYYPPGGRYQNEGGSGGGRAAFPAASFDRGSGTPSRDEQIAAQQLGVNKYNAIQQSIDNYARPFIGYGVGGYGGFY